ncbi:MAG TPA: hypothetical protein VL201_05260 [Patescibacteria group bacterium]|jgi:hypothetical protein|nr:hypothetical protein [Patescibacteria group bacterium]
MKNSIFMTLSLLLTPLVSLPMGFLKNMFYYKNINTRVPVIQARTYYSHYINDFAKLKKDHYTAYKNADHALKTMKEINKSFNKFTQPIEVKAENARKNGNLELYSALIYELRKKQLHNFELIKELDKLCSNQFSSSKISPEE